MVQQESPEMKAQCLSLDRISTLPQPIIETILSLVPIKDAVRTSVLSRNWRYNWTKIPKLVFNEKEMFGASSDEDQQSSPFQSWGEFGRVASNDRIQLPKRCKVFYAIFQVLITHTGPIHEFSLTMEAVKTCVEIDQIITYLSKRNTVTKFTLGFRETQDIEDYYYVYWMPVSICSLHQLTDLSLHGGFLNFKPSTISGFGDLRSLSLINVKISQQTILPLLSSCPLLKRFTLISDEVALLFYCPTFIELFKCLPLIEHLSMNRHIIKCFAVGRVPRELPTTLVHLKYLCIYDMMLVDKYQLPFLTLIIRSSPNLQKIKLEMYNPYTAESEPESEQSNLESESDKESDIKSAQEDDSDIWLENLKELEIDNFTNNLPELDFVSIILAKSPVLKKVRIGVAPWVSYDEERIMLKFLLRFPRASPVVEIVVDCPP